MKGKPVKIKVKGSTPAVNGSAVVTVKKKGTKDVVGSTGTWMDGTATLMDIPPGEYDFEWKYPNFPSMPVTVPVFVHPDVPTTVNITVPPDVLTVLLENTPIEMEANFDLSGFRTQLTQWADQAGGLTDMVGGQPIMAQDWNSLAAAVQGLGNTTRDLSTKVAPWPHTHPQILAKLDELQDNITAIAETAGQLLSDLQRDLATLQLAQQVEDVVSDDEVGLSDDDKADLGRILDELEKSKTSAPWVWGKKKKAASEQVYRMIGDKVASKPELEQKPKIDLLLKTAGAGRNAKPKSTYLEEAMEQAKANKAAFGSAVGLGKALKQKGG